MDSDWIRNERERGVEAALRGKGLSELQRRSLCRLDKTWVREDLAHKTREHYAHEAIWLGRFLRKPFEEATREDLEAYLDDVSARRAPTTVATTKQFLKSFYKRLLQHDGAGHPKVVSWIRLRSLTSAGKLPSDLLTAEEVKRLVEAASNARDRALLMVLYDSGARASELLGMHVGDVEFDAYGARAMLRGKTGMRKIRLIDSVPDLQAWLEVHPRRKHPTAPLWQSCRIRERNAPLRYDGLRKILRTARDRAGLDKRVHAHLFRHSRMTELAKTLTPAEQTVFAGWRPGSSMAQIYVHLSGEDVDAKLLEKAGLLMRNEQGQRSALEGQACPRCQEKNSAAAGYCSRCTMPLADEKAREWETQQELLRRHLPRLLELLGNRESQQIGSARIKRWSERDGDDDALYS